MCDCNKPHLFTFAIFEEKESTNPDGSLGFMCEVTENGHEFTTFFVPSDFELGFMMKAIAKMARDDFAATPGLLPPLFSVVSDIPSINARFNTPSGAIQ